MTAHQHHLDPLAAPFRAIQGMALMYSAVYHAPAFSDLLSGLGLHLSWSLTWHQVPDVRWIEGYNAWCGRWAAAQSHPGPPNA